MKFLFAFLFFAVFAASHAIECPAGLKPRCGTGETITCDNYKEIPPTDECVETCLCANPYDVYDVETKRCIHRFRCIDSDENRKCEEADPNTQYNMCPRCGNGRFCRALRCVNCICKPGYARLSINEKCEPMPYA